MLPAPISARADSTARICCSASGWLTSTTWIRKIRLDHLLQGGLVGLHQTVGKLADGGIEDGEEAIPTGSPRSGQTAQQVGLSGVGVPNQGSLGTRGGVSGDPPCMVVVIVDDMGWGYLSCFGSREGSTPNIDRLAAEGIRFCQFYVNSPICSPSRTAPVHRDSTPSAGTSTPTWAAGT